MELDETDRAILEVLREDARASYRDIAERVDVSTPTVSRRVRTLEQLGLIRGYGVVVDPVRAGETITVLTVEAVPGQLRPVAESLSDTPGVREVLLLAGSRLLVRVHHREARELHRILDRLDELPGVTRVEHDLVREVVAGGSLEGAVPVQAEVDVPCHECHGPIHGTPVRARLGGRDHVFCCETCRGAFRQRFEKLSA